jgi:hypothetical protein
LNTASQFTNTCEQAIGRIKNRDEDARESYDEMFESPSGRATGELSASASA